jgi:hypothetical protein
MVLLLINLIIFNNYIVTFENLVTNFLNTDLYYIAVVDLYKLRRCLN